MRVKLSNVKVGDTLFVFDKRDQRPLIHKVHVNVITNFINGDIGIGDIVVEKKYCEFYTTFEECMDRIRTLDKISNFDKTSFMWYLMYIKDVIDMHIPVYVIRERKYGFKQDRYLDRSYITRMYYDGTWKIITTSSDKYITTMHRASSLGLRVFFSEENAINKLNKLKGGIN